MVISWHCDFPTASTSDCYATETSPAEVSVLSATSSPVYTQDSGNISLGLAIIIALGFLMVAGFIYNNQKAKRPWR